MNTNKIRRVGMASISSIILACGFSSCRQGSEQVSSPNRKVQKEVEPGNFSKGDAKSWTFEDADLRSLPGYLTAPTGSWSIQTTREAPSGNKALVQTGKEAGHYFNLAVVKGIIYKDLDLSVKFKALAGEEDQGGGVVWRYQDSRNYYIARANPLEDNYRVYKVVEGKRSMLESARLKIPPGWHEVHVLMRGHRIWCYLDGKKYLQAKDDTFRKAGQVGVWTKADAQTAFDDLKVNAVW